MNLLGFAWRNLRRRPGRSVFTLAGVALAVASYMTLGGLAGGLTEGTAAGLKERRIDISVSRKGIVDLFGGYLPENFGAEIAAVPGVEEVSAELITMQDFGGGVRAVIAGWMPDGFIMRELKLKSGRLPKSGAREVLLGEAAALAVKAEAGTKLTFAFTSFTVTGIADFGSGLMKGLAILPLSDLQALLGQQGQVNLFQIRLKDPREVEAVRARIAALRPDLNVAEADDLAGTNQALAMLSVASIGISIVAMLMAALTVLNTLAMAVEERVREIGILGSVGWPRRRVLGLIAIEGIILAGIGGVIGIGLGQLGAEALSALLLPGSGMSMGGTLWLGAQALAAAFVIGGVGAFWPALRAANLDPAAALRRQ